MKRLDRGGRAVANLLQHFAVTANSAAALIPANVPEYLTVTPGQVLNFPRGYVVLTEMT